jgi:thiol-disulfide isomerase/thioredoxin
MHPMKEEREKDFNGGDGGGSAADGGEGGNDCREWKQVVGGFVPKFLRRRMEVEAASASAIDTKSADGGGPRRPTILAVDTLEDYKRVVVNERDSIVVLRFHAPWCKSCKSSFPLFSRMASDYRGRSVKF